MTNSLQLTWERYVSAWKATKAEDKAQALKDSASEDCVYRDPITQCQGQQQLLDYMLEFHQQMPGVHFMTTYFLEHHHRSLARWNMLDSQGNVLSDGASVGEYDSEGKLVAMTGFFETPGDV